MKSLCESSSYSVSNLVWGITIGRKVKKVASADKNSVTLYIRNSILPMCTYCICTFYLECKKCVWWGRVYVGFRSLKSKWFCNQRRLFDCVFWLNTVEQTRKSLAQISFSTITGQIRNFLLKKNFYFFYFKLVFSGTNWTFQ